MDLFAALIKRDGKISHTKFWSNIIYLITCIAFSYSIFNGGLSWEIWALFVGMAGTHNIASKFIYERFKSDSEEVL